MSEQIPMHKVLEQMVMGDAVHGKDSTMSSMPKKKKKKKKK